MKIQNILKEKKKIIEFFSKNIEIKKKKVKVKSFIEFIKKNNIGKIDFIKIDTEGYEFKILKNIEDHLNKVYAIQFEHHYDLMILKDYKFRELNNLLTRNNFKQLFKSKMIFRKSFEYIYINKKFKFD